MEWVLCYQLAIITPQNHVLDRNAALVLEVNVELPKDGYRARPERDGRTEFLELRCGLEDLQKG
jgi:hypothetical protein